MLSGRLATLSSLTAFASVLNAQTLTAKHPLTISDILDLQRLGAVVASPAGRLTAVQINRTAASGGSYLRYAMDGYDRSDIWLASSDGGLRDITHGEMDGSTSWAPRWSPDGSRLAFLSTKGGDDVRLYVWDSRTDSVVREVEEGLDLDAAFAEDGSTVGSFRWLDNDRLVCVTLPRGKHDWRFGLLLDPIAHAEEQWSVAQLGREPTANVAVSGLEDSIPPHPPIARLVEIYVPDRHSDTVGAIALSPRSTVMALAIAPVSHAAAILIRREWVVQGVPTWTINFAVRDLSNPRRDQWLDVPTLGDSNTDFVAAAHADLDGSQFDWNHSGTLLAFWTKPLSTTAPSRLISISRDGHRVRDVTSRQWRVSGVQWLGDHDLLVRADVPRALTTAATDRTAWWLISIDSNGARSSRNVTRGLTSAPTALHVAEGGRTAWGIADGALWSFDIASGRGDRVIGAKDTTVSGIAWPTVDNGIEREHANLILTANVRGEPRLFRVELVDHAIRQIAMISAPSRIPALISFDPVTGSTLFYASDSIRDTALVLGNVSQPRFKEILSLNNHLKAVEYGQTRRISYRNAEGDTLNALVILPVQYEASRTYPLITYVYGGMIHDESDYKFDPTYFNLQLLAAHGYAVLLPSIPLASPDHPSDPYLDIPKSVLPAVDRAVELGIADPSRIGLMGHSYGGYTTYALVTYTSRFRAAIAMSGSTDLVSYYNAFDMASRYGVWPLRLTEAVVSQEGQFRMAAPPWSDRFRNDRNSPISYVDRVQTPLLMIVGDLDGNMPDQAEEFFTALARRGEPAQLVRYAGEAHTFTSAANIRDVWRRIFGWFDRFLANDSGAAAAHPATLTPVGAAESTGAGH